MANAVANPMGISAVKIVLWAQDMDRALGFYTNTIGLSERFSSPGWSEMSWGDAIIALHGGGDGSERITSLSLQVADLDAACKSVRASGGKIINPPEQRQGEPIRLATVCDTEGNHFMLTQYVG